MNIVKIEILGTGCQKCKALYEAVENTAKDLGLDYTISKVEDIKDIVNMGAILTPALAINGKIVHAGGMPSEEKLKELLGK